ncbi:MULTISPECIES: hypothetical protein [Oscillospiraceae]|uniref:Uncharacterized protein n=1 Tax=Harryflintia acetispora TaxID=1849041 RepID=A0A9X8UKA9_9FIRM|nr:MULTISPECIES: hypothetical protein [Oscillospiraceae]TCL44468.1 hypothetical protein EDD78_10286 [Harryflintia acetispora]
MKQADKQNKKNAGAHAQPTRQALRLTNLSDERTDPLGSYTGQPANPNEVPVQDADDL